MRFRFNFQSDFDYRFVLLESYGNGWRLWFGEKRISSIDFETKSLVNESLEQYFGFLILNPFERSHTDWFNPQTALED